MASWQFRYALLILIPLLVLLVSQLNYFGSTTAILINLPGWLLVEDLILGYSWEGVGWIGSFLVSWAFWSALSWAITEFTIRHYARAALVILTLIVGLVYLGFRTTHAGEYTFYRSWGYITHATMDDNLDGRADTEVWFSWRAPLFDIHSTPMRSRSDRNFDGVWDTWVDYETNMLRIDINGDGIGDTTLEADHNGYSRARELRGF